MKWYDEAELERKVAEDLHHAHRSEEPPPQVAVDAARWLVKRAGRTRLMVARAVIWLFCAVLSVAMWLGLVYHIQNKLQWWQFSFLVMFFFIINGVEPFERLLRQWVTITLYNRSVRAEGNETNR